MKVRKNVIQNKLNASYFTSITNYINSTQKTQDLFVQKIYNDITKTAMEGKYSIIIPLKIENDFSFDYNKREYFSIFKNIEKLFGDRGFFSKIEGNYLHLSWLDEKKKKQ